MTAALVELVDEILLLLNTAVVVPGISFLVPSAGVQGERIDQSIRTIFFDKFHSKVILNRC